MYTERKLMLPETSLQLVSLGYDADNATLKGTSREGLLEILREQIFGKLEGPMVLFNNGCDFSYNSYRYTNPEKHEREAVHYVRFSFPAFGLASAGENDRRFLSFFTINNGQNLEQCFSMSTKDMDFSINHGESYHYFTIGMHDKKAAHEWTIWPFGGDELYTEVIVPYLPKEKRDPIFWRKVAELSGMAISKGYETKDHEGYPVIAYDFSSENGLVNKLTVSSSQEHYGRDYLVHIEFKNPIKPADFRKHERYFKGQSSLKVDGEYISCTGKDAKVIDASIDRNLGHQVLELVRHAIGYDAKKLQGQ
jgi:hypothetical protein